MSSNSGIQDFQDKTDPEQNVEMSDSPGPGKPYYLKVKPSISEDYIKTTIYGSKSKSRVANVPFSEPDHASPGELDGPDLGF